MKKLISIILAAVMCLSLAACGGNSARAKKGNDWCLEFGGRI